MKNLLLLAASGLVLAACSTASTPQSGTQTGSSQAPSMAFPAPPPNTGISGSTSTLLPGQSTDSSQSPSMSPVSSGAGVTSSSSSLPVNATGGQSPSMAPVTGGAGVVHTPGITPPITTTP